MALAQLRLQKLRLYKPWTVHMKQSKVFNDDLGIPGVTVSHSRLVNTDSVAHRVLTEPRIPGRGGSAAASPGQTALSRGTQAARS